MLTHCFALNLMLGSSWIFSVSLSVIHRDLVKHISPKLKTENWT